MEAHLAKKPLVTVGAQRPAPPRTMMPSVMLAAHGDRNVFFCSASPLQRVLLRSDRERLREILQRLHPNNHLDPFLLT